MRTTFGSEGSERLGKSLLAWRQRLGVVSLSSAVEIWAPVTVPGGTVGPFGVSVEFGARHTVLGVRGEVDVETGPVLDAIVGSVIDGGHRSVVLDLAHCEFMDARGLRAVGSAIDRLAGVGAVLTVRSPSAMVAHLLDMGGFGGRVRREQVDPGPTDVVLSEAVSSDPGPMDAVSPEAGSPAAVSPEAGPSAAVSPEAGPPAAVSPEAGSPGTSVPRQRLGPEGEVSPAGPGPGAGPGLGAGAGAGAGLGLGLGLGLGAAGRASLSGMARQLTKVTAVPADNDVVDGALRLVVDLTRATVGGADGVSVSLRRHGRLSTVAATDQTISDMDADQYDTGEGPCVDASVKGRWFHAEALVDETRWPTFVPRARTLGINAILSSPLLAGARPVGALNIYSRTAAAFTPEDRQLAATFASGASAILTDAGAGVDADELADRLAEALERRAVISQAQGAIMALRGLSAQAAYGMLLHSSIETGTPLLEVARVVVAPARLPDASPGGDGGVA